MEEFPIIHTNVWDAVIAVPSIVVIVQLIKWKLNVRKSWVPTIAGALGLIISIFIAHPHSLASGLFMGFFYGNAAVGLFASYKTAWLAYKKKRQTHLH
ncbi:UNVERIFIED_CONTAM: hypothetical protein N8J90_11805 [Halobacillus marinus]|uniref:hypothetical protein n=1 Tax=Halobacillus sp. KGW1 TaxID=1793726 RepID=UPI0007849522|nr:hypothetical protein [Halobacillus sp. KGW1]